MHLNMLRTLQTGAALLIVAALSLAVLLVVGVLDRAQALVAARDVGLLLVLGVGACCALIAVLRLGANKGSS